jgi:hypothetical protein
MSFQERVEKRLHRLRADRNWLFVKSLFRPTIIIVSYKRSGFQWFRQICYANLRRHAVMPPGARYQHFNIERVPRRNRLDRNALLLVRDGRDVMVSLFMASTRDGANGARIWEGDGTEITFHDFLRTEFMELKGPNREILRKMNPVDYWAKFHTDWLANPNVVHIVRYERLLEDQSGEIRDVMHALGYRDDEIRPVEVQLDFDKHSPVGRNVPKAYQRKTTGNWRRLFTPEDSAYFEERAGHVLRTLGYETDAPAPLAKPA